MIAGCTGADWQSAMITGYKQEKSFCRKCGKELVPDEIAMTKKLINRGTTTWYCTGCLAETFAVTEEDIREKIQYYKNMGCTLFVRS